MRRPIIAAVDGSARATAAARVAASLARRLERPLIVAHVVEDRPVFPYGDRRVHEVQRRRAVRAGTDLVSAVAAEIGEEAAGKRVVLAGFVHGDVAGELHLLCREEAADLLVVGARARGPVARSLFGSRAAAIASSAPCPVVVVPERARDPFAPAPPAPIGPVVCGVDGSLESERARVVAAGLAESAGLRVLPTFVDQLGPWSDAPEELCVEVGDPAQGLAEAAERHGASLIAVGTRGRRAPLGSVARELVATAHVPVMIVPPPARLPYLARAAAAELAAAA